MVPVSRKVHLEMLIWGIFCLWKSKVRWGGGAPRHPPPCFLLAGAPTYHGLIMIYYVENANKHNAIMIRVN